MGCFTMWQEQIVFKDGWFIYMDGKGNNSVISHERARDLEAGYQQYQASMDINRGGAPDEQAYQGRGFTLKNGRYIYENYCVDRLITGKMATVEACFTIPSNVGGISINCIAGQAFQGNTCIRKVILHSGIKEIGEFAFEGCSNLQEVSILNDHIIIKTGAFKGTALTERETLYLNKTLTKVSPNQKGVFAVKDGTTAIADHALKDCCGITEIVLPDGLISIGKNAFQGCTGLKRIALPKTVHTIGDHVFSGCTQLADVIFPDRMDKIGMAAFDGCTALTRISLPEGISEIERATFNRCDRLQEVHIPESVTTIWFNAFTDCGLFKDYQGSSATQLYIGNWLIHYKWEKVETLDIREGTVGVAGMNWAKPTKLHTLKLPRTLKYIGYEAFNYAPITSLELPSGLRHIDVAAFRGTGIKSVFIPKTVTEIEQWAFMDCENIESITVEGEDTGIVWPAITGRRDKKPICICAPHHSKARQYCLKYGEKYNLVFEVYKSFWK